MADIFATDICKSALVSFSTTIWPHGWNNFAAVEWIFINTNYLWLKSYNTNILHMKAYMFFACILNITHFFFAGQEMFQTEVIEEGCNTVSLLFVVFEIIKKENTPQNCYAVCTYYNLSLYFVSIIWHLGSWGTWSRNFMLCSYFGPVYFLFVECAV